MIVQLVYFVFSVAALSGMVGNYLVLTNWGVPGKVAAVIAFLSGGIFGQVMAAAFTWMPGPDRLYDKAPVNGATGQAVTAADLWGQYFFLALSSGALWSVAEAGRHHRHLPPLPIPHFFMAAPLVLASLMAIAWWIAIRREPDWRSRRQADYIRRRADVAETNEIARRVMIDRATELIDVWRAHVEAGEPIDVDHLRIVERDLCRGIASGIPYGRNLMLANGFIIDACQGLYGKPEYLNMGRGNGARPMDLDEAMVLIPEVVERLKSSRPIDIERVCEIGGTDVESIREDAG